MGVKLGLSHDKNSLKVHENRVQKRTFGHDRKWQEAGEHCIMRSFVTYTPH
jgi:hypothetical protein